MKDMNNRNEVTEPDFSVPCSKFMEEQAELIGPTQNKKWKKINNKTRKK